MKLAEGVHLVDDVTSNVYTYETQEGVVVVDTGRPGQAEQIAGYVENSIGQGIGYIVVTHSDGDHLGSAAELQRITGAKLAIHEEEVGVLSGEDPPVKGGPGRHETAEPDLPLRDGDQVAALEVLHTPGHTPGHVCLYSESDQVLFAGDATTTQTQRVMGPSEKYTMDMETAVESLKKVSKLPIEVLCAGHGPPLTQNAGELLQDYLERVGG